MALRSSGTDAQFLRNMQSCTTQGGNNKLFQKTGGEKLMEENYSVADEYDNREDIFEDIPEDQVE